MHPPEPASRKFGPRTIATITTSELPTKTTQLTTFYPRFSHPISTFIVFQLLKTSTDKPQLNPKQSETHHNSPQTPKTSFIHNQVVGPPLLTFGLFRNAPNCIRNQSQKSTLKKKAPSSKGWGLRICHTYACSTIGPTRLNFRVRDGNGCDPRGKLTGKVEAH